MLVRVYEDQSLSMKRVYQWCTRFREGRESVSENPRSERPAAFVSDEKLKKGDYPPNLIIRGCTKAPRIRWLGHQYKYADDLSTKKVAFWKIEGSDVEKDYLHDG
ncbi:hypothetical protein TNCV_1029551 [Trichonephila clavipes]|nr:hypothetical protein TNCV_1029551 [Trichonephila clavipes]